MGKKTAKTKPRWFVRYFGAYNFLGTAIGLVFAALSFLPSLLPRGWVLQGFLTATTFCFGYAIGVTISFVVRKFKVKELAVERKRRVKCYTYTGLGLLLLLFMFLGAGWQKDVKELMGLDPQIAFSFFGIILSATLLIIFFLLVARSIRTLFHWLSKLIDKLLPRAVSYMLGFVLTAFLVIGFVNGFLIDGFISAANESFGLRNGTSDEGVEQPSLPELSGSPQSLIAWDTLGRQGRNFISRVPSTEELSDFNNTDAMQPIRVYSGLESADDTKSRADLAVDDLKRAGGFNRDIVVVVTTTGTGWVDEEGVVPVEYMYNGDSAVVAMQYSYLPSWISFLVDQSKAKDAGNQLYNAIYEEALSMPERNRPKVVVFGESLGSFGGEAAFANESAFKATTDGAVWAGPPNFNALWGAAVKGRDEGTPEILPIYKNGENVRFAATPDDFKQPGTPWGSPKAAYLQNPSDPITWWSPNLLFNKPDWLSEPRGADVSPATMWFPIVTFWQVTGDMMFSTNMPDGHGHKYGKLPTDAWGYVAPPEGWTLDKTEALKAHLIQTCCE